ncbi:MAG: hypothetical protein BZY79_01710 [SAR202 cluster bacterium Casp-Chloro-G4]|nr:sulfite exporter TauE/SafE family protein [Chloroflexota bacterium]MDA1227094.1 sulfite exporter TauE/SafE family protein [Chloroflexota bacterium]PKB61832.1 MAG: hypothetical protein BZY79_01710 [SAR202 cluster bacterium Casp-Chloro-G4]
MDLISALLGALVGLVLGTVGAGGSLVAVPALVYVVGLDAKVATTASLIIVGSIALGGMAAHLRAGRVRIGSGLMFGITGIGGSFGGSYLNRIIDPNVLLLGVSLLMAAVAVTMLRRKSSSARDETQDPSAISFTMRDMKSVAKMLALGTAVGFMAGFFGVGGGIVVVPALSIVMGFTMRVAIGTSLLVITFNSAVALASRLGLQQEIPWGPVISFTLAGLVGVVVGSQVAGKIRSELLARGFGVVILLVAGYTAVQSIREL